MKVNQISVFLENKPGRVAKVTKTLAEANINIRALCVADTVDYGLVRLIVDDPQKATDALAKEHITAALTEVLALEMPDRPGGLNSVVEIFAAADINIEYMYAFVGTSGKNAIVVFRIENINGAIDALKKSNIKILTADEVQKL